MNMKPLIKDNWYKKAPHPVIQRCYQLATWEENKGAHFLVNTEAREIWIHRHTPGLDDVVRISLIRVDEHGNALFNSPNFELNVLEGRDLWNDHVAGGAQHLRLLGGSPNRYDEYIELDPLEYDGYEPLNDPVVMCHEIENQIEMETE